MDRILESLDCLVNRASARCKSFTKYTAEMEGAIDDTTEVIKGIHYIFVLFEMICLQVVYLVA